MLHDASLARSRNRNRNRTRHDPDRTLRPPRPLAAAVAVTDERETDVHSVRATTSTTGKGTRALRDIPQSRPQRA